MVAPKDPERRAQWIEENRARTQARMSEPEYRDRAIQAIKDAPKRQKGTLEYEAWKNSPEYEVWASRQRHKPWSKEEEAILRENYLTCTASALTQLLPQRSARAISYKAMELGITKYLPKSPDAPKGEFVSLWEKRCTKCGKAKNIDDFRYEKKHGEKHGFRSSCNDCERTRFKKWHNEKRAKPKPLREIPPSHKYCVRCDGIKSTEQFSRNKRSKDGLFSWCKDCTGKYRQVTTPDEQARRDSYARSAALKRYGITVEQYNALLQSQGNVCAVCQEPETVINATKSGKVSLLGVDHDHATGKVRGLLCQRCNQALGLLNDEQTTIESLLRYIKAAQEAPEKRDVYSPSEKTCGKCNEVKSIEKFRQTSKSKGHYSPWCRTCIRLFHEEYWSSPEMIRVRNLRGTYGMTAEEYDEYLTRQNSACAVCYKPETIINHVSGRVAALSVDHDHQTGRIRGLLCQKCNHALGKLRDDPMRIEALLNYVAR